MQYFKRKIGQGDLARILEEIAKGRGTAGEGSGAGGACGGADGPRGRRFVPYEPSLLGDRDIILSSEALAQIANAEIKVVRSDCFVGESELGIDLRRCLARIEGIASIRTNGVKPDYRACCYMDLLDWTLRKQRDTGGASGADVADPEFHRAVKQQARSLTARSDATVEASYAAHLIERTVEYILIEVPPGGGIATEDLFDLYRRISEGSYWEQEGGLRTWDYRRRKRDDVALSIYVPTPPAKLPIFIDDLVAFCNRNSYSPVTKSAIAHYQLEATKAFTAGSDQLGRVLAILIWRKGGVLEHYMPPFSITPAMVTMRHIYRLEPYLTTESFATAEEALAVDEWVYHCARACELGVRITRFCHDEMRRVLGQWEATLDGRGVKRGRTTRRLLCELLGSPVVSIPYAAHRAGLSFTTVSGTVEHLVDVGILRQTRACERNRVFEAPAALALFEIIETALLPKTPTSRESLIEQSLQDLRH